LVLLTAIAAGSLFAFSSNCALLVGLEHDYDLVLGGNGGVSPTGGSGGTGGVGGGVCGHATWPPPPDASDPGADDVTIVVAFRNVDIGETDLTDGPTVGYDLDKTCTCRGESSSCILPEFATGDGCDGPLGRDNAVARLFDDLSAFSENVSSTNITANLNGGEWGLLLRVSEYNGQPNDDDVTVALLTSGGRDEDTCLADQTPKWDGTDAWPVSAAALYPDEAAGGGGGSGGGGGAAGNGGAGGGCSGLSGFDIDAPKWVDTGSYVTDGFLVSSLPNVGVLLKSSGQTLSIRLVAGTISGRLELEDGAWRVTDGHLAGRWPMSDALVAGGKLDTSVDGGVCTDNQVYQLIKNRICTLADISSELPSPTTPCDSLSFGMAFDAYAARIGIVHAQEDTPSTCTPELDPAFDTCETPPPDD
jgi:hypothetical protein